MIYRIYNDTSEKLVECPKTQISANVPKGYKFEIVDKAYKLQDFLPTVDKRVYKVKNITVTTTTGNTFDGDEDSQNRMMRAIKGAELLNKTSTLWKLADNTKVEVTLDELKEALGLAMSKQSEIWMEV